MSMIAVYADWDGLPGPQRLGFLHSRKTRATERFEFEYDEAALTSPLFHGLQLDPGIQAFGGPQYPVAPRDQFGVFKDSSPDRWGRLLMDRRFERDKRQGLVPAGARLYESDYLLGVHDVYRVGALRYRLEDTGDFLDNRINLAAPPFTEIRALEQASRALERDPDNVAVRGQDWLRMLIAPGGSLGGARPKASVVDDAGRLYIAKFPSTRDTHDVGGWEMVVNALASGCGLNVAAAQARKFASDHHCFIVRRFDRTEASHRLHFASAMTLTGHSDGDDASTGASYLELAEALMNQGAQPNQDLRELWSRIVFNILVSNTDDHLRNHGFILVPGLGWKLSPAYDMNPVPYADGLKLNITDADNALDLELTRQIASYFRLPLHEADEIINDFRDVVGQWRTLAQGLGLSAWEQDRMAEAFRLAA
ncbi:type II toxin-antitoxin system HipA family toxin [Achromobacter ruhlandii]|uniref:HipA-like C-terminal domain-containing protein n=1 Tax=Achromobacter ruhlandii TaxID=72557 RepID=A0ABM8LPL8_9BURK|nr:HipA domain-containing protein [Achromobacter ruhlandii]AKP92156.1 HipA protein [Achromobacter xylosoxidans]AOU95418.1 toxin HipA [Achromobacter ruhlandii]MCZ8435009.1 HipA domain-containing protein [Achromobacter ruhlandii]MDC6091594.1 HipA domain-containing protein [Achromobacter ruhlandii]MDC6153665.1 HipA domain-containing protein [Achromobacter ruhlandii]